MLAASMGDVQDLLVALQRAARAWWIDRRSMGTKLAALRRLRHYAGTEWLGSQLEQAQSRMAELERRVAALPELAGRMDALENGQSATGSQLEQAQSRMAELERRVAALLELRGRIDAVENGQSATSVRIGAVEQLVDGHRRQLQVRTVMDWVEHATVRTTPLVSVVLPTRDRCALLPRAIASVDYQTYPNWELLIIDDGSADDTPALLAGISDKRLRTFRAEGAGVCAARNIALAHARGELIAYLDDDNIMHPAWLKAVVWAFGQRPEAEVLYGAFVVDDTARIDQRGHGDLPRLYFYPYDHHAVAEANVADIGCIAHRAGLAEARFDESLREMGDWDLFLRLTRGMQPLALPAIACFYTTDAPNRLSNGPTFEADMAAVRIKNRR
jgi:hypothetical protein